MGVAAQRRSQTSPQTPPHREGKRAKPAASCTTAGKAATSPDRVSWPLRIAGIVCLALLALGFANRHDTDLVPDAGVGYALGIVGLGQMVLMLSYSLRKRVRAMQRAGAIQRWFEVHMILGIAAPTALLLHCNFDLGSLNASIALFSTLFVAGSGIAGRFLYVRLHRGLLGERVTLSAQLAELRSERGALAQVAERVPGLGRGLDELAEHVIGPARSVPASLRRALVVPFRARTFRARAKRALVANLEPRTAQAALRALDEWLRTLRRTAVMTFYEWLFGLWHAVHVPLCVVLFGSAAVHVVAVHVY